MSEKEKELNTNEEQSTEAKSVEKAEKAVQPELPKGDEQKFA